MRGAAGQRWDPERYARNARFVSELGLPLVALLAPRRGEHILDLGCGDGALTQALRDAGATVVGVDASAEQVAAARRLGHDARVMDGERLDFPAASFDAVFSNAALHWMRDPDAVLAGVARVLVPGGRFAGEMGGAGNVETVRRALHLALERRGVDPASRNPWYFPTAPEYAARLAAAGLELRHIESFERLTALPSGLADWLDTFAEPFLAPFDPGVRDAIKGEVEAMTASRLRDREGSWHADYVRLRFLAARPDR